MRDVGPGDSEDAWIAFERAVGELGQLAVEAARKVVANLANLLLDDMKVIDQPFGGGGYGALFANRGRGASIHVEQDSRVGAEARRDRASGAGAVGNALRNRERLAMLLETLDTEQFGADRLFFGLARE